MAAKTSNTNTLKGKINDLQLGNSQRFLLIRDANGFRHFFLIPLVLNLRKKFCSDARSVIVFSFTKEEAISFREVAFDKITQLL